MLLDPAQFVKRYFPDAKYRGDEATATCPFCNSGDKREQTFSINTASGVFTCNRKNNCGESGTFKTLHEKMGIPYERPRKDAYEVISDKPQKVFRKPEKEASPPLENGGLRKYVESRGLDWEVAKACGIQQKSGVFFPKTKKSMNAAVFPTRSPDGTELYNLKACSIEEKDFVHEKECRCSLIGMDLVNPDSRSLLITEGQWDWVGARMMGCDHSTSMPNGTGDLDWIELDWDFLCKFDEIYLNFDSDKAGVQCAAKVAARLGKWRCFNVQLPAKDNNDFIKEGYDYASWWELVYNARDYKPAILRNPIEFLDDILAEMEDPERIMGAPTGFAGLDAIIKGWRPQEVTLITGVTGSGKTTWIQMTVLHQIFAGHLVCIASLEVRAKNMLREMAGQWSGTGSIANSREKLTTPAIVTNSINDFSERLWMVDHVDEMELDFLIEIWTYAARRYGVKYFVLDSLMLIEVRGDDFDGQKKIVRTLCNFAAEFDAHVWFVVHPRKTDSNVARLDEVGGAMALTGRVNNVLALGRSTTVPNQCTLAVHKNRSIGPKGEIPINVDIETKQMWEQYQKPINFYALKRAEEQTQGENGQET
jgi:twinkle protein